MEPISTALTLTNQEEGGRAQRVGSWDLRRFLSSLRDVDDWRAREEKSVYREH
jgi:hypothetical protein